MPSEVTIREIFHANILTCPPDTPLSDAAARMVEARCSSILVEDGGRILGIWTEQDALALDMGDAARFRRPISEAMSAPVKSICIDTSIGEATVRFREEGLRHFLVVDGHDEPCGIVSQTDVVINQGVEYFLSLREIESVFNRRHPTISAAAPLAEAVRAMHDERLDALIVQAADGGHGILTERDVVRLVGTGRVPAKVGDVASFPLATLALNASLYLARKMFVENRIRHLGVTGADGQLLGLVTFADILMNIELEYVRHLREALRETQASLAASDQRLRLAAKAFESTYEGILITDAHSVIESVNPAFTQITGYAPEEVIGRTPALLSSGRHDAAFYRDMREALENGGHWQGEICNRRKNGEIYVEWLTINAVRDNDDRISHYVGVFTDFTTRKAAEEHMRFLAHHDALTGLPNRILLTERLRRAIPHARRNARKVAVIFLDLDKFKAVNDAHGHNAGDHLLRLVAQRLVGSVRGEDTVARLAGDEFVVVLEDLASEVNVPPIVIKLVESLAVPAFFEGEEVQVTASIGISLYPDDGDDPDELVRNADLAMYRSKEKGGNLFHFFGEPEREGE